MSLLDECIQSLGKNIKVLSTVETGQIFSMFEDKFAISPWGRIKWEEVDFKIHLESASQIIQSLNQYFSPEQIERVYILWDESSLPVVEASLHEVINMIDEVTAVSFDTWLFVPNPCYVIEFYHEGDIWMGIKSLTENNE
jgi:hypothetical protein